KRWRGSDPAGPDSLSEGGGRLALEHIPESAYTQHGEPAAVGVATSCQLVGSARYPRNPPKSTSCQLVAAQLTSWQLVATEGPCLSRRPRPSAPPRSPRGPGWPWPCSCRSTCSTTLIGSSCRR